MAARKSPTARTQDEPTEWIGACIAVPHPKDAGAPPVQLIAWRDGGGDTMCTRGASAAMDLAQVTVRGLQNVMQREGAPPRPDRVRVAVPEMAEALRAAYPNIEVICAPTPEMETVSEQLVSSVAEAFRSRDAELEDFGAFFRAAAILFRAEPWTQTPDEKMLLSITIKEMDLYDAVLLVVGQNLQDFAFLLFEDTTGFLKYYSDDNLAYPSGEEPASETSCGFQFTSEDELSSEQLEVVRKCGWDVASPIAYPTVVGFDGNSIREHSRHELNVAEKVALVLAKFMVDETVVKTAGFENIGLRRTYLVDSDTGEFEASIGVSSEVEVVTNLMDELTELAMGDEGVEHKVHPAHFNRDKRLFTEGVEAGYDMKSEEEMREWAMFLQTMQRPRPSAPSSAAKNGAKAKKKRKAARKARKKNR